MRPWRPPQPVELPETLVTAAGGSPLARLLFRRGFQTPEAVTAFLTGGIEVDAPGLPDLDQGVALLSEAVRAGERICVYGDYDTDGVTSTALLVGLLRLLRADVTFYVPNRFEDGYGMNSRVVQTLAADGIHMILTCDCGIKNFDEVAAATTLGMKVVVTDHHELGPELPKAGAVINPKRLPEGHPCRMLPGVGTAYLVARQLLRAFGREPSEADRWLDLVSVGVIADVVPLHGANRELARRGLSRIRTSACVGIQALLSVAGLESNPDEEEIAFQVVPRLNSAGRLADASLGVKLLLCNDPAEAREMASQLDRLNQERKKLTAAVVETADKEVGDAQGGAILLYHPEWHEGVLGIAAGRLAEQHGVPALLMARKHGSGLLVGSARAPEGFSLHEALDACGEHLIKYGGHAAAAGFSLLEEHLPAFRAAVREEVRRRTVPGAALPEQEADLELPLALVNRSLYDLLRQAAPFGEENPAPVLFAHSAVLLSARPIGPGEKHLRLVLRDGEQSLTGLWWGAGSNRAEPGEYELYYRLGLNRWNGEELLQVVVEHLGAVAQRGPSPVLGQTARTPRPQLVDRRGAGSDVLAEFPGAVAFAEGPGWLTPDPGATWSDRAVDRYRLRAAPELVLLTPLPSPRLLDEALAITGAQRLIMAWPTAAPPEEDRFLPALMRLVALELHAHPYVSVSRLAVATAELEQAVLLGIAALAESNLLAIEEERADVLRLRRRTDGRGVKECPPLGQMHKLLAESRAFRRFLRSGMLDSIGRILR